MGIDDIVVFHGESVAEIKREFKDSIEFYLEVCAKDKKKARKTYSGKVLFRLPSELHAKIAQSAVRNGKSINEWGKEVLESAVKA